MSTVTERHAAVHTAHPAVTQVVVSPGGQGRPPRLAFAAGLLAPRLVGSSPGVARVALVATTATLLGGDEVHLRIRVAAGQRLELEDVAATVAYAGRGRMARWSVAISVEPQATLVWRTEPFVVSDGARVIRQLDVDVARGGRVLVRDVLVLGRHGERGGDLRCRTAVSYDGAPLLVEDLDLAADREGRGACGALRHQPGILGAYRVAEAITCVAEPVPQLVQLDTDAAVLMHLPGPGFLMRSLASSAHASQLDAAWADLANRVRSA